MAITHGNWTTGKLGGTVISDTTPVDYNPDSGHDDAEYYGGFLLAESVGNNDDAKLFAESKNLLVLAAQVVKEVNRNDLRSVRELDAIIKKYL